jgi:hypothetical protein
MRMEILDGFFGKHIGFLSLIKPRKNVRLGPYYDTWGWDKPMFLPDITNQTKPKS